MFDLEKAILDWRKSLSALRASDIDELESHLREELDALAEVGIDGERAFAHATLELGQSEAIVEEIERAAPRTAWRGPAIALLTGVLVHLLGGAVLATLDWIVIALGYAIRAGVTLRYLGIGVFVLLGPFVAVAGGLALAPRVVERLAKAPSWARISVVMSMGIFVMTSHLPWLVAIRKNEGLLRAWTGWRISGYPVRAFMYWAAPILLALAMVVARRLAAKGSDRGRFAFWALGGYALVILAGTARGLASSCAAYVAELAGGDMERAATMTAVTTPILLGLALVMGASKVAVPSRIVRSPLSDAAVLVAGTLSIAFAYGDHALLFGVHYGVAPPDFPLLEAVSWSQFGTGIVMNLCLAPIAAAGLLRLRSTT